MDKSRTRPRSVVDFERVYIANLVVGLLAYLLGPAESIVDAGETQLPTTWVVGIEVIAWVIVITLSLFLLWLVARRGNPIARGIYIILEMGGLVLTLLELDETLATLEIVPAALMLGGCMLSMAGLWLILRPEANAWFAGRPYGLTDIFR